MSSVKERSENYNAQILKNFPAPDETRKANYIDMRMDRKLVDYSELIQRTD